MKAKLYPWHGEMITISEASRRCGIDRSTLIWRMLQKGMTLEEAAEDVIACRARKRDAKRFRMSVHDLDPSEVDPAEFARKICSEIYSGTPEESEFSEVEPDRVYTFRSRHYRCRVEVDGNHAELQAFWAKSGKLSLVRKYRQSEDGVVKMIVG